jgi:hypothetical protein
MNQIQNYTQQENMQLDLVMLFIINILILMCFLLTISYILIKYYSYFIIYYSKESFIEMIKYYKKININITDIVWNKILNDENLKIKLENEMLDWYLTNVYDNNITNNSD